VQGDGAQACNMQCQSVILFFCEFEKWQRRLGGMDAGMVYDFLENCSVMLHCPSFYSLHFNFSAVLSKL
jgi:hypothetical protein